ncbi:unnamed protein product [Orchesella dallaii]|uniref:NACHT domain-containing protein n=1 Tax=Orchesella dallaii TaxID=48710 RepID=A0ABP1PM67_9HEXA
MVNTQEEYYFRALENMLTTSEHVLRKLFHNRWEEHFNERWDYWNPTSPQVKKLLDKIKKHLNKPQKSTVEDECMGDWDMTLLCIVLTKYFDEPTYTTVNEGVRQLKDLRNGLAHNPSKKVSQEEYNQMVNTFSEQLMLLQVNEGDIKQMIQEAEATVIARSSFVSSLEGINEFSTWSKLSFRIRSVLSNRLVLYQGRSLRLAHFEKHDFQTLDGRLLVQLANGETPTIVRSRVPLQIEHYVDRTIMEAHTLKREVFESKTNDVFVIQGIQSWELTKLAGGCETDVSGNQTRRLTVKFILLEHERDFKTISEVATVPVHWIHLTTAASFSDVTFTWVKSHGCVQTLKKYARRSFYQQGFGVAQILSATNNVFLISGSPGIGKTCELVNIAHEIMKRDENIYVQFINLKQFVQALEYEKINLDSIVSLIAEQSSKFLFGRKMVHDYLREKRCLLMFDGFDEVLSHQVKTALEVLQIVITLKSVLVLVTTRLHMRDELENALSTLAYELKPLDDSDQMVLLLKFWELHGIEANTSVQQFARSHLKLLQDSMIDEPNNQIAGIPLQCQFLAETCLEDVERCSKMRSSHISRNEDKNYSIFDMYQAHMNMRLEKISKHDSLLRRLLRYVLNMKKHYEIIKEAHMYYALNLFFSEHVDSFQSLNSSSISLNELCGLGILEATNLNDIRFVHRSFAEYLVAWFVVEQIDKKCPELLEDFFLSQIFKTTQMNVLLSSILGYSEKIKSYKFEFPAVCFFINEFLARKVQTQPVYNANVFNAPVPTFFASAYHNYQFVLIEVSKLLESTLGSDEDFTQSRISELLLTTAQFADVELMKVFFKMWDVSEIQFKTCTLAVMKEFAVTPLHVAVVRGHYNLVEFLLNEQDLTEKLPSLIFVCISGSLKEDKATILKKKEIIMLILMNFGDDKKVEYQNILNKTVKQFKSIFVNGELLQCVIHAGAAVSACDSDSDRQVHNHHDENDTDTALQT